MLFKLFTFNHNSNKTALYTVQYIKSNKVQLLSENLPRGPVENRA